MTPPDPPSPEPSAALRAQLLATEHWSLLATRLTQVRVQNVAMEDLALVLAMNRLRAA